MNLVNFLHASQKSPHLSFLSPAEHKKAYDICVQVQSEVEGVLTDDDDDDFNSIRGSSSSSSGPPSIRDLGKRGYRRRYQGGNVRSNNCSIEFFTKPHLQVRSRRGTERKLLKN